jgi:RNA polymerase sigma-70 factor (ECF subfamily)
MIADYAGRGDLAAWLLAVAKRAALKLREREGRSVALEIAEDALVAAAHPEIEYLKARYASVFEDAFREAFAALSPRQRNLLRQHHIEGATLEAIATRYRVHRATGARWLAAAREAVLTGVRASLEARQALSASEIASLFRLAQSAFDLHVSELLPRT